MYQRCIQLEAKANSHSSSYAALVSGTIYFQKSESLLQKSTNKNNDPTVNVLLYT